MASVLMYVQVVASLCLNGPKLALGCRSAIEYICVAYVDLFHKVKPSNARLKS